MIPYLIAAAGAAGASGGSVVTLTDSDVTTIDAVGPYNSNSGIRVNTDGTIDSAKRTDGAANTYAQINASTDWIIPNGAANSDYEVRITGLTLDGNHTWASQAAAENTWVDLSVNREWIINGTVAGLDATTFTLEIRYNGGATLDTAAISLETEHTS